MLETRRTRTAAGRATPRPPRAIPSLAAAAALAFGAACGGSAPGAPDATATAGAPLTATPGTPSHDVYAQRGFACADCHPCGTKDPNGHQTAWMDTASTGFHAIAANQNLAGCQSCHGAALDGVGGSTAVSCARCHGATWRTTCTMCHGGTNDTTGAPPKTTWGNSADAVRVGAHASHVSAAHGLASPVGCATCHPVPTDALSAGHANGTTADVAFTGTPGTWDRGAATCASTYCHGATLSGGTGKTPVWTSTDGTYRACGACHGAPPPAPHVQNGACGSCHTGYTATSVSASLHLDGKVDVIQTMTCSTCHGSATNAAPPAGTQGETLTSDRAVGAHQAHLAAATLSNPVACNECHVVPTATGHADGNVALTWGALASADGATPGFDGAALTCANYCHGQTLGGGGARPIWNRVDGTQDACGTCHGAPPPSPHPANSECGSCHAGYTATTVARSTHVNGTVEVTVSCNSCHGSATNSAPPAGTQGETLTSDRAVGAHQAHLAGGTLSAAVACSECHAVPTSTSHSDGTVQLAFGPLARTGGATPSFDPATLSCSGVYCHGQFTGGNLTNAPAWTVVNGTQDACGTCHGLPPAAPHSTSTNCGTCHTGYTQTSVNVANHMNGSVEAVSGHPAGWADPAQHGVQVNLSGFASCTSCHALTGPSSSCTSCHASAGFSAWDTTCNFCHGSRTTGRANPPVDIQRRSVTTNVGVGVHESHVTSTLLASMACTECHPARSGSVTADSAHVDGNGVAEVSFGTLARTGSAPATYARASDTSATCASTYCHGRFTGGANGGNGATMSWTSTTPVTCTSCHGAPPASPHPANSNCAGCHTGYTASTVNVATHLNGAVDVQPMTCTSCHGNAAQTATAADPLHAAPPVDAAGASTGIRVGAHQKHLVAGTYANPISCQTCHASVGTYTTTHGNGVREVGFTGAANTNLRRGTWTAGTGTAAGSCSATWCHGAVINRNGGTSGGTATTPSWTGTITACTACHAVRAGSLPNGHTRSDHQVACTTCHGTGYGSTGTGSSRTGNAVNRPTHVDGTKTIVTVSSGTGIRSWNASTRSCQPSCHGTETW